MEQVGWLDRYRGWIRGKTRIGLAWFGVIAIFASTRTFPNWPGILICFLGATLRFWGSGYLMKDTELSRVGPYAYTRNPLYFGTFMMAIGGAIAIENLVVTIMVAVVFTAVYHFIIMDEEEKLARKFGSAFMTYRREVPRFWPQFSSGPIRATDKTRFDFNLAMKNKAYEAYLAFLGMIAAIWAVAWIYQRSIQF